MSFGMQIAIMFLIMVAITILSCVGIQMRRLRYEAKEQKYSEVLQAATKRRLSARIHKQKYLSGTKSE